MERAKWNRVWLCVLGILSCVIVPSIHAANITSMAEILANMRAPRGPKPVIVKLPSPPALVGALSPNDYLTMAQSYALNLAVGPESMVVVDRYIYTGLRDGWVSEIRPDGTMRRILRMSGYDCGKPGAPEGECGRPMGIRADSQGFLIVADAYKGIFKVHPRTGDFRQLVDSQKRLVNGKPLGYINDLAVAKNGVVFFTSSSTKWKPSQLVNIIFEGETTGRVLVYNPHEKNPMNQVQVLVSNLHYPNGLQLGPNEEYLLIGEGGRSRIFRAWIARAHPKHGKIEVFAENLPGFVDNIRSSPRKTYWVALSRARHAELPSVLDTYGDKPDVRANLINMVSQNMVFDDPNFGIVVELDASGKVLRSLQDPDGSTYTSVSEVEEENGVLFLASKSKNFIGLIDLNNVPDTPRETPQGTGTTPMLNMDAIQDPNLKKLLEGIKAKMLRINSEQIKGIVLLLAKRLYEVALESKRRDQELVSVKADLQALQENIGNGGIGGGGGGADSSSSSAPTTPSSAGGAGGGADTSTAAASSSSGGSGGGAGTTPSNPVTSDNNAGGVTGSPTSTAAASAAVTTTAAASATATPGSASAIPTTTAAAAVSTTTSKPDTTTGTGVASPDAAGSAGIGGSPDGGVSGGGGVQVASSTTTAPAASSGSTASASGATTSAAGATTPSSSSAAGGTTAAAGAGGTTAAAGGSTSAAPAAATSTAATVSKSPIP